MAKERVKIVEVGPRDGLQNEPKSFSTKQRIQFIKKLILSGVRSIETGSFVSPKWVPQMENSGAVYKSLKNSKALPSKVELINLVPNLKGLENAETFSANHIAIFAAVSESFSKKNINRSIQKSFEEYDEVVSQAKKNKIKVRAYLSTCFYCPYEGKINPKKVIGPLKKMLEYKPNEISIGDTIGAATPKEVQALLKLIKKEVSIKKVALHMHDTRGTALANIYAGLEMGVRIFDSSLGGLGGCPYAPGASGNVATEDVVYMLENMGFKTGIDIKKLQKVNFWVSEQLKRPLRSQVSKAGLPKV